MKKTLLGIILSLSTTAMANSSQQVGPCYDQALSAYSQYLEELNGEFMAMYSMPTSIVNYYGGEYENFEPNLYPQNSIVYEGQSNYWGGVGVEAITVDPTNCAVLGVDEIYAE